MPKTPYNKGILGCHWILENSSMVPEAGLEPARLATVDFESTASTIPPLGQVHKWAFKPPHSLRQSRIAAQK